MPPIAASICGRNWEPGLSTGIEYRPLLSNNVIVVVGVSTLIPGSGFKDLFNSLRDNVDPLVAAFADVRLTY